MLIPCSYFLSHSLSAVRKASGVLTAAYGRAHGPAHGGAHRTPSNCEKRFQLCELDYLGLHCFRQQVFSSISVQFERQNPCSCTLRQGAGHAIAATVDIQESWLRKVKRPSFRDEELMNREWGKELTCSRRQSLGTQSTESLEDLGPKPYPKTSRSRVLVADGSDLVNACPGRLSLPCCRDFTHMA